MAAAVRAVGAIQSQEPAAAALAVRARLTGVDAAGVEAARTTGRSVVRTWAQRGTLQLLATEDVGWVLDLLGPRLHLARRWTQLGLDEDTWKRARRLLRTVLADGPRTKVELAADLEAGGVDTAGQRFPHLVARAALAGDVCDGPDRGAKRTWVLVADWLGGPPPPGPTGDAALAELARRHLAGHGPCDAPDLAAWSGLAVTEARRAWTLVADDLVEVEGTSGPLWQLGRGRAAAARTPVVRLLAGYDAYLLGYRERALAVPEPHAKAVNAGGGFIAPTVAVDGVVVGTWSLAPGAAGTRTARTRTARTSTGRTKRTEGRADGGPVTVELFDDLTTAHRQALDHGLAGEVADVVRFVGRDDGDPPG